MAEHILCTLRSSKVSANFFRRRADAYKTVSDLILNPSAGLDDQLCGLICLQMAEHTIGHTDLQAIHLKAMHQLMERRGGMQFFLSIKDPDTALTEPMFYASQYMFAEFDTLQYVHDLGDIVEDFVDNLRRVVSWSLRMQGFDRGSTSTGPLTDNELTENRNTLSMLNQYLSVITNDFLREQDTPYHQAAGVFYLLFNLCVTLADFGLCSQSTTQFLASLLSAMKESTDTTYTRQSPNEDSRQSELSGLHPCVVACLISQFRRKMEVQTSAQIPPNISSGGIQRGNDSDNFILEVRVSDSTVNAMIIYPLLSAGTRLRLTRGLLRAAMAVGDPTLGESFGDSELQDLEFEISSVHSREGQR